jgi:hypothetical protein
MIASPVIGEPIEAVSAWGSSDLHEHKELDAIRVSKSGLRSASTLSAQV